MGIVRRRVDGRQVLLAAESVVGRMPSCTLLLEPSFVSTAHALIRWSQDSWEIRDLGSRNGTYVGGARLEAGAPERLKRGATIVFGEAGEAWELVDDVGPTPAAIPLDGGEPSLFTSGIIAVPMPSEPWATIYLEGDAWFLETDEAKAPLTPGQHFHVAGREWRFECPSGAQTTAASNPRPCSLDGATLIFTVSHDEEHVALQLRAGKTQRTFAERACLYLAFVLARQRLEDKASHVPEHGWVDVELLLKMVPEYRSYAHLNVEIFRLRKLLGEAGVADAARIIERRRGQVRFGTEGVEVQRAPN